VEPGYWCQFIYQFSHELTHFVIRSYKKDKDKYVKWFEETVCEAMSLFVLRFLSENWQSCSLSEINSGYNKLILQYLDNEKKEVKEIQPSLFQN
jgi:uncharacterized membrane protein YjjP (DUF1212 family)